jgi:hypothetical protein
MIPRLNSPAVQQFIAEISGNVRLQWILAGSGAAIALLMILTVSDWVDAARSDLSAKRSAIIRLSRIADEKNWDQRAAGVDQLRAEMENKLWPGDTDGVARADFQDWVDQAARLAAMGAVDVRPDIEAKPSNALGLRKMSASVTGVFDPAAFDRFLNTIYSHNRLLVIEKIKIQTAPIARFDMYLATYLRPRDKAPGSQRPAGP